MKGGSKYMNNKYNKDYIESANKLPDLFKELQDIRYGHATPKEVELPKEEVKSDKVYKSDRRFNLAGIMLGVSFLALFIHRYSIYF